jgi:manganese/iron transport system permease protein
LTNRLPKMMIIASVIASASGLIGLFLSYYLSIASGAAIVLTCTLIFAVTWVVKSLRSKQSSL